MLSVEKAQGKAVIPRQDDSQMSATSLFAMLVVSNPNETDL